MIARRSFLRSMLAACVAPQVIASALADRQRWVFKPQWGFFVPGDGSVGPYFIEEFKMATLPIDHRFVIPILHVRDYAGNLSNKIWESALGEPSRLTLT